MTTLITKALLPHLKHLRKVCKISKVNHTSVRLASNNYQAAVFKSKDATELTFEEKKQPKLKDSQVRIAVAYCSVNIYDVTSFSDTTRKFPFVPGYEFSGEIIETGKEAAKLFNKEDRVIAFSFDHCGGLATECVVDYEDVWTTPASIQLKEAAVLPYSYAAALYTFGVKAPIKECSNVVVAVGPAGSGLAAVDVAANIYKAKVVAVTDTEKNSELTREKGAFTTLHYKDNIEKHVISAFGNKRADVIFDAVGGEVHDVVTSCVDQNGKIFTLSPGKVSPPPPHSSLMRISLNRLRQQNLPEYRQIVQDTLEMAEQGMFTAHISEKFDFKEVNKAVEFIKSKKCTGKVVVKVN